MEENCCCEKCKKNPYLKKGGNKKSPKPLVGETCLLNELREGQVGELISFQNENKALRRRLLDMGLTKGVKIEIRRISPLGDPIEVNLRGYDLCLRKDDMKGIVVKVVD